MTYQKYLKLASKLTDQKNALYDIASHRLSNGDNPGAQRIYAEIDAVQKELDALVNPQDYIPNNSEELTLKFDS